MKLTLFINPEHPAGAPLAPRIAEHAEQVRVARQLGFDGVVPNSIATANGTRPAAMRAVPDVSAFGDPTGSTAYALCVYGGPRAALQSEEKVAPGAGWTSVRGGFSFGGPSAGVSRVSLRGGRHSGVRVRGAGPELGLPYLPLDARGPLLVRLHSSDGGCFAADFAASDIVKNEAAILRAAPPDRPGRLVARVP